MLRVSAAYNRAAGPSMNDASFWRPALLGAQSHTSAMTAIKHEAALEPMHDSHQAPWWRRHTRRCLPAMKPITMPARNIKLIIIIGHT